MLQKWQQSAIDSQNVKVCPDDTAQRQNPYLRNERVAQTDAAVEGVIPCARQMYNATFPVRLPYRAQDVYPGSSGGLWQRIVQPPTAWRPAQAGYLLQSKAIWCIDAHMLAFVKKQQQEV